MHLQILFKRHQVSADVLFLVQDPIQDHASQVTVGSLTWDSAWSSSVTRPSGDD